MNYQQARADLLNHPAAWEDFPFGPNTAVMKVRHEMFATLAILYGSVRTNLKCDADEALLLRDILGGVIPGYHMNKRHWNTVILDADVPRGEIERMMYCSHGLVVKSLNKQRREALILAYGEDAVFR